MTAIPSQPSRDRAVRAITADGSFRAIALSTGHTTAGAIAAQDVTGAAARTFGELLTAAILVRETMAPTHRLQIILKSPAEGSAVADAHPDGLTRGLCDLKVDERPVPWSEGALLQVIRTLPRGQMHQGIIGVEAGATVSELMLTYMQTSEQVVSTVAVGCLIEAGQVLAAGGYIVQLLPELTSDRLEGMTARLASLPPIDALLRADPGDPRALLAAVLEHEEHTILDDTAVHFGCTCDEARVVGALATIGRAEIEALVRQGAPVDMDCDYCASHYSIGVERLKTLLEPPS